jgi:CPA1 family monovalent cation:H+ antiporter
MNLLNTVTVLVCLSAVFGYLNYRLLGLPTKIGLMVIALAMSLVLVALNSLGVSIAGEARTFVEGINFNLALMQGMLSFLLFAGALHVNLDDLFEQRWIVAILASVGVVSSTFIVGTLAYYLFDVLGLELRYIDCLLFGALISPTDPIAVGGILKLAKAPKSLETKIMGESLFNDGVGIVVFLVLLDIAVSGEFSATGVVVLMAEEAIGGIVIGLAIGYTAYRMLRSTDQYEVEILITLALVMGGYALASFVHASGPIAIVVAGLMIGNHGRSFAMSDHTREHLDSFWELTDEMLNAILFVLIGLELVAISLRAEYLQAILVAIPLVLLSRFVAVGLPIQLLSLVREFSNRATLILTWGGLRGGISVALALSLPAGEARDAILTITYGIVAFSIIVQGLTIGKLVQKAVVEGGD